MKGKTFQLLSIALAFSVVTFFGFSADAYGQTTHDATGYDYALYVLTGASDDGAGAISAAGGPYTLVDGDTICTGGQTMTFNSALFPNSAVYYSGAGGTLITAIAAVTVDYLGYWSGTTTGSLNMATALTVTKDIQVGGNTLVFVTGTAALTAGGNLHVGDTGVLDFNAAVTVANDISLDGAAAEIQVADATTVTFTGDLTNTADNTLTLTGFDGGDEIFDHNGTITLGADLTLDPDANIGFDVAGVTSFTATSDAAYDADGVGLAWTALATFGGDTDATLTLLSAVTQDEYELTAACAIHNLTIDDDEVVSTDNGAAGNDVTVADGYVLTFAADAGAGALTLEAGAASDLVITGTVVYQSTTAGGIAAGGGTIVVDVTGTLELGSDVEPTAETITFSDGATISVDGSTGARAATLAGAGVYTIGGDVNFAFDANGGDASLALRAADFAMAGFNTTFYVDGTNASTLTVTGNALTTSTGTITVNGAAGTDLTINAVTLTGNAVIAPNADVTITTLTLSNDADYAFNFGGGILTVGSNVDLGAGSLTLGGVGSGSLRPAAAEILDLTGPALLTSNNIGLLVEMGVTLGAGTIVVDKDLTISGNIAALADGATVDILAAATLEYTGAAVTVPAGVTLDFPGGGTFDNTNAINLTTGTSFLDITTVDGAELNKVTVSNSGATIDVGASATINTLQLSGSGGVIDLTAAETLTLTNALTVSGGNLSILGNAAGTVTGGIINVTGNYAVAISGGSSVTLENNITLNNSTGASITTTDASHVLAGDITTNKQATITVAAGNDIDISGDIVVNDTLTINKAAVITYTGADIAVGTGQLLKLQGDGAFDGSEADEAGHDIILDGSAVLDLEGTGAVDTVDVLSQDVVIEVDANLTVAAFRTASNGFHLKFTTDAVQLEVVAPIIVDSDNSTFYVEGTKSGILYGAGGISLLGADATLQIKNTSTPNINKVITLAGGGILDINQSATFGQKIILSGDATFDIASGLVFSYNKDALNIGAATLTVKGGGTLNNTGTGVVVLNNAASVLAIEGGATATTINIVTLSVDNRPIQLNAGSGTINTFNRGTLDVTFEINSTGTFTVPALTFSDNETLTLTGTGAGTLDGGKITANGTSATLLVTNSGGLTVDNNVDIGNTVEHAFLDVNNDAEIGGDVVLLAEAEFDVNSTLTYTGADIDVGAGDTLFVTGSGDIDMDPNVVLLSTAASVLRFDGTSTVSAVESGDNAAVVAVNAAGGIGSLTYTAAGDGVTFDFINTSTFTVADSSVLSDAAVMLLKGKAGTLAGTDQIKVTGEAAILRIDSTLTVSKPVLIGSAVTDAMLDVNNHAAISGNIVLADSATFDVDSTLTYTGSPIAVNGYTLTLEGAGVFDNSSAIVLDDSLSILDFVSAFEVGMVESGHNNVTIDVGAAGTIDALSFTAPGGGVTLAFTTASTFTVTDASMMPGGAVFTIGGAAAGTLAGTDELIFGDEDVLKYDDAGIDIAKPLVFGGSDVITPAILDINEKAALSADVDFAGYVDFMVADTLFLNGDASTSDASILSATAVDSVIFTGAVDLAGDLTLVGDGFDITGITGLTAASNSTLTVPDSVLTFTALTDLGGATKTLTLTSSSDMALIIVPDVDIDGTVSLADDDTLMFDGLAAMDGNVVMNGTGKILIVPDINGLAIDAILQAVTGVIEIADTGFAVGNGDITLQNDGEYMVVDAAGEIILPANKTTTVISGGVIILTDGVLRGSGPLVEGGDQHTITAGTQPILQAAVTGMTGGIIHNLHFTPSVMGFSTMGVNITGYSITVYVDILTGDDTAGDGSLAKPYKTLEKGVLEAVDVGIVAVKPGKYILTATLNINKEITIKGIKLNGLNAWTVGTPGAADEAPTIAYTGDPVNLLNIAADNVSIQGFKIMLNNNAAYGIFFTGTVDNIGIMYNTFVMDDGDRAVTADDGAVVTDLDVTNNTFAGAEGATVMDWFTVGEMTGTSVDDVLLDNNWVDLAVSQLRLGEGDISDVTYSNNTIMNNNGILLSEPTDQSTGQFSDITVMGNKFKGDMDYAFMIAGDVENADFVNNLYDDAMVTNNHFFFGTNGDYEAVSNMVADADTSLNAEDNWWGSIDGPNQTAGADASANVDYTVWKFLPELAGNEVVINAVSGGQRSGMPIYVTVFAGFTGAVEFHTNFEAITSALYAVEANNPHAFAEQTFEIIPNNAAEVTNAKIKVFKTGDPTIMDASNGFDITVLTSQDIYPIGTLTAIDNPFDNGGYVILKFVASPNHPGYTTVPDYVGDTAPIDYYQIYRSSTGSFEQAIHWSVAAATPKAQTQVTDTVRVLVNTAGDLSGNATYYVTAVKGDLPPPLTEETPGAAAKAGVLVAYKPALAKSAVVRLSSVKSNGNRAIGARNTPGLEADFNSDGSVNLADFDFFVWAFGNDEEFDPLFEIGINKNQVVDLPDFDKFVSQFGMSMGAQRVGFSDGLNADSWFELKSEFDYDTELLELQVLGNDFTSLAGYGFDLVFDPEQFEIVNVYDGGYLESEGGDAPLFINNSRETGRVSVANILMGRNESVTPEGSGLVAIITMQRTGGGQSSVSVENIDVIDHAGQLNSLEKAALDDAIPLPEQFELKSNYPNPFNPSTTIEYTLPTTEHVTLVIYNSAGQVVKTLVSEEQEPGVYKRVWDSTNEAGVRVASGLYIYKITAGKLRATKTMTLIK